VRTVKVQTKLTPPPRSFEKPARIAAATATHLFSREWAIDVAASTDGIYIVDFSNSSPGLGAYSMDGSVTYLLTSELGFFCQSAPLPICQSPGFPGDMRTYYDTVSKRWIASGIWVNPGCTQGCPPGTLVLAVSATNNPLGAWFKYQSPVCGPADLPDVGDQPHLEFNRHWIVVNSRCDPATGYSLQVFDKAALYSGQALCGPNICSGQTNWWEFKDNGVGVNNDGREDDPVATYNANETREYLVHAEPNSASQAQFYFSVLNGPEFAPQLTSDILSIKLFGFAVNGNVASGDTPTCTGCMHSANWPKVESAQLRTLANGDEWLFASAASFAYPAVPNTNFGAFVGYDLRTRQTATSLIGAPNTSIMSTEINAVVHGRTDAVNVVWVSTASNFYPGFQGYAWNVHTGTISNGFSYEGSQTPTGFSASRWLDFTDAAMPIPGGSTSMLAAPIAGPSASGRPESLWFAN
jgi:hypothetical protein